MWRDVAILERVTKGHYFETMIFKLKFSGGEKVSHANI